MRHMAATLLLGAAVGGSIGCAKLGLPQPKLPPIPVPGLGGARAPADPVALGPWTPYPEQAALGADLDMIVTQGRGILKVDNRTPRSFKDVQLWLNLQYVAQVTIHIGSGNPAPLTEFRNKHGEHFPIAGFLTPDKGFPILSCILFDPATGRRHRLVARK